MEPSVNNRELMSIDFLSLALIEQNKCQNSFTKIHVR